MGVQDSLSAASLVVKITLCVGLIGNLCNWISFTTSSWFYFHGQNILSIYFGLWRVCQEKANGCSQLDGTGDESLRAVQTFAVFGFVSLNVAVFLLVLFMFWTSCKGNSEARWASAILFIVSAVAWLISVIVYGADYYKDRKNSLTDLGFSFGLAIVSLIFSLAAGVLLIVDGSGSGSVSSH